MASVPPARQGLAGFLFAPLLVGFGYAVARTLPLGRGMSLDSQGPFMTSFFAGVLVTLALRPVLSKVPWSREVALAIALGVLAGTGVLGEWCAAWLATAWGLAPFPLGLPPRIGEELLGVIVAAFLMGMVFRPQSGPIDFGALRARLSLHGRAQWALRLGVLCVGVLVVWLVLGWGERALETAGLLPDGVLSTHTLWLELTGQAAPIGENGNGGVAHEPGVLARALLIGVYALRAVAMLLPLLPIALLVRGAGWQLVMLFGLLLFIVGEFVPLMHDQPYSSTAWLLARTGLGAIRAALVALLLVATLGRVRGQE